MEVAIIMSSIAIILTMITAGFSIAAYAKVIGMEKSTHRIQYQNVPETSGPVGKDLAKKFEEMYNQG